MKYANVIPAVFLARPNRFIARVLLNGAEETVHVKNTGRCRELLVPGARVWLAAGEKPGRKTAWDLIAVEKKTSSGMMLINMDSQAPNQAAAEWLATGMLFGPEAEIHREVVHGDSRFDFQILTPEGTCLLEVKGCTLEQDGLALFPDAPTQRGVKHLRGLTEYARQGGRAIVLLVIQMKGIHVFTPNRHTDPAFADAMLEAKQAGVEILALDCVVTPDSMRLDRPVKILLD